MRAACGLCHHRCSLEEGGIGFCRARENRGGEIVSRNYGKLTSLALDPIEKKPLMRFFPGSRILSAGSFGCNFRCPFCQNSAISMSCGDDVRTFDCQPGELVDRALELRGRGSIGIAYTYNEPLVGYEYVYDCAKLARSRGLRNVVVTNGCINGGPFDALLEHIDAMNIDLKSFTQRFYSMVRGDLETVKRNIAAAVPRCHVELTTLIIPGENDSEEEMDGLSAWVASLSPDIPLHISRFFPRHEMQNKPPTPVKTVYDLAGAARKHLRYVYTGNC